jgi:serine/threonine-protein kinase
VEAAIRRALEKLPADRFQSAAEFATALNDPTYASRITVTTLAQVPNSRWGRPWVAPVGLGAIAILVAVAAWGWLRPSKPILPIRYRVTLGDVSLSPDLVGRDLAISPDGRTIVFSRDSSGHRQLWIKTADRADPEPLTGTVGGRAPSFSPDGEWVAFVADRRLRKVPRLGGSAVTIADSTAGVAWAIAWLDNGTVLFNGPQLDLRAVQQDGGPVRIVLSRDSLSLYVAGVSGIPGGHTALVVLCAIGCAQARLLAVNLESGVRRDLAEDVIKTWAFAGGRMAFVRKDGGVFLASVDEKALAFRAAPLPVLEGVQTSGINAALALAADGTLLFVPGAAEGGGDGIPTEAVWVTRDGKTTPVDSGWSFGPAGNGGLALSPDGRRLALAVRAAGAEDVWIKELDRGPFTRLTFEGFNIRPAWTDGGRSLLYLSRPDTVGSEDLKRRRADGTGPTETLLDATRSIFEVRPLRDTTQLLVRLGTPPTRDIYLLRRSAGPGDSALTPLLADDKFEEVSIVLSPDERWLAYASNESGRYEVYVRPFPDVNAGRWQISRDGGNEPLWSHTGRELLFRNSAGWLVSVPVGQGPGFTQGEHRPLFQTSEFLSQPNHTEYDLTPDDRRFIFLRRLGVTDSPAVATTAVMVQHWLAEVDARRAGSR